MTSKLEHTIHTRRPANDPSILQLYSFATPNGVKVSIALEEIGLPYEPHTVTLADSDVKSDAFLSLNPNGKIPAIIDPNGPGGQSISLFESGAILIYLADKTGQLLPSDAFRRFEAIQWVMFQMGGIGPMFGQYGFFSKFAGKAVEDPLPRERYRSESVRLLRVLEDHLADKEWIIGDEYTIADIAIFPWIRAARDFYDAGQAMEMDTMPTVMAWLDRCLARPASQRGLIVPPRD
jgi:GST-like protein